MDIRQTLSFADLSAALQPQNCALLVANQRLKRFFIQHCAATHPGAGLAAGAIFTLDDWCREQWWQLQDAGTAGTALALLSPSLERALWRQLLREQPPADGLLSPDTLAQTLQEARAICAQWNIDRADLRRWPSPECQLLARYLTLFEQRCAALAYISLEDATRRIGEHFRSGAAARYHSLLCYGFSDLSPLFQAVLEAAAASAAQLVLAAGETETQVSLIEATDEFAELTLAAQWAEQKLRANPRASIGIIAPQLSSQKAAIRGCFDRVFSPSLYSCAASKPAEAPYDLSMGDALYSCPVIYDLFALQLFRQEAIDRTQLITLCQSPYWGAGVDAARSQLLDWIQNQPCYSISCARLSQALARIENAEAEAAAASASTLAARLVAFRRDRSGEGRSHRRWADHFIHQAQALGWPGPRPLNSHEYQAVQRLLALFDELAGFDTLSAAPSYGDFCQTARELCQTTLFHPQTPPRPIQIMGLMEGAGLRFDHCWVMGMSAERVPAAARPNPLIPYPLQRQKQTPKSTPEKERLYAEQLLANYRQSAPELVLSVARSEAGSPCEASPLLLDFSEQTSLKVPAPDAIDQHCLEALRFADFDAVANGTAPAIPVGAKLPGGSGHLKMHAVNPLYAFLWYRLGARPAQQPSLGLTPAERGSVVHLALATLWQQLKNRSGLCRQIASQQLPETVDRAVEQALAAFAPSSRERLGKAYLDGEQQRIGALLCRWLRGESERDDFSVIAVEQAINCEILGRSLSLRIDRVDQLESGDTVVIDYKTRAQSLTALHKRPLGEPQLPLYALNTAHCSGLAYAQIETQQLGFSGIGAGEWLPGMKTPEQAGKGALPAQWQSCLEHWRTEIEILTDEITRGHCPNQTFNPAQAAYYAYLRPLARDAESQPADSDAEDTP